MKIYENYMKFYEERRILCSLNDYEALEKLKNLLKKN